ncbi:MAG: hypothetical protein ACYCZY_10120 [Lacisediminihabitans sp.]
MDRGPGRPDILTGEWIPYTDEEMAGFAEDRAHSVQVGLAVAAGLIGFLVILAVTVMFLEAGVL